MTELSINFCRNIIDPYKEEVWCYGILTKKMVKNATPINIPYTKVQLTKKDNWTIEQHAGRVLYLAQNGWDKPIEIDVGIPGYCGRFIGDGCHRIAAAIYLGQKWIKAEVSGCLESIPRNQIRDGLPRLSKDCSKSI